MHKLYAWVSGWWKPAVGMVLLVLVSGCAVQRSNFEEYLRYRGEDLCEVFELGVTVSDEPQFALYLSFFDVAAAGYAETDGTFHGLGGGQAGTARNAQFNGGFLLWGQETVGWGKKADTDAPLWINNQGTGLAGLILGPNGLLGHAGVLEPGCGPDYLFAFMLSVHLGNAGVQFNFRTVQLLDFLLGIACIDFAGDDGYQVGEWSAAPRGTPEPPGVTKLPRPTWAGAAETPVRPVGPSIP